jgi:polysaccharide deacetylase 2 family uncharacterized protein YibQ
MADDDLSAPLGQHQKKKKRFRLPVRLSTLIAGALALCLATVAGWALFMDDPFGGEPMIVVSLQGREAPPPAKGNDEASAAQKKPVAVVTPAAQPEPAKPAAPSGNTVTIIDGSTGKRQEVHVAGPSDTSSVAVKPASGIDQRLLETTRHGAIPKVAPDGTRAAEAYARPVKGNPNGPRVAIVIVGLGVGQNATSEAFAKLPAPVTFAFTPYGSDLGRWVARARGEGHEVLLQVGMEPFDYPDNDPGPQTLLTSAPAEQNLDRLQWFMSRFQGYVGITNLMGQRFTATEPAFAPVLREIVKRGLLYLDDGSSPRSLASQIAGASNAAFARADAALDASPSAAEIDAALAKLEAAAKSRGVAVGTASALPVSIDRIAQWAKAAEARGITLVPISAVANKPKQS